MFSDLKLVADRSFDVSPEVHGGWVRVYSHESGDVPAVVIEVESNGHASTLSFPPNVARMLADILPAAADASEADDEPEEASSVRFTGQGS